MFSQGCKQAVVAEPTVADNGYRVAGKMMRDLRQNVNSLLQFGLKQGVLSGNLHIFRLRLDGFSGQIETVGKGETSPTPFDEFQDTGQHHILCLGILGLVCLGGMIKDGRTAEYLFACFGVDEVIQCDEQTSIGQWFWNHTPQGGP